MDDTSLIKQLKNKILTGGQISDDEAYLLADCLPKFSAELRKAAAEITKKLCDHNFDSCSIINARSGLCGENCKWCAQSRHHNTGCETYDMVDRKQCLDEAAEHHRLGIGRFSMVASGRAVKGNALTEICEMIGEVKRKVGIGTCASLGLLNREELKKLYDAGVKRYHCNLETAPSHFAKLCTTHTIDDKIATIKAARELGFEICSGGIIGMGESMRQRAEFGLKLREVNPVSIPINILSPIQGTPLENEAPISEDEILDSIALMRFIHPHVILRFAGGRRRVSRKAQAEALKIGINGAIMGDMLTTLGSTVADDIKMIREAGYTF